MSRYQETTVLGYRG